MFGKKGNTRSDLQNKLEAGGVINQDVAVFSFALNQIDYGEAKNNYNLRVAIDSTVAKAIAAATAKSTITQEHVSLMFTVESKEKCKVQSIITPVGCSSGDLVSALKASISKKPSLAETISKGLAALPRIETVSKDKAVQVIEEGIPESKQMQYPDLKLEKKHGIPAGVFCLFDNLHILDDCRTFGPNKDELVAQEVVWAMKKVAEVYKDARLEKLFTWMVTNVQKKDKRAANDWAAMVAPNTLQFILSESPAKDDLCGRASSIPRDKLIAYASDCVAAVAVAIVAGDALSHWTYDFGAPDQMFLGEAVDKLGNWQDASVPLAQGLWDRVACRFIIIESSAKNGSCDVASAYLQRCPRDILCSKFKAPWRGPDADGSFFHLYPTLAKKEKDAAEQLIDCMAQADVYSSADLSEALRAFMEDPEVSRVSKKELLLSFVSACRRWEVTPAPAVGEGPSPRKCSIFNKKPVAKEQEVSTAPESTKDLELIALDTILKDSRSLKAAAAKGAGDATAEGELSELLEAVLLLSSGDSLTIWSKKMASEDAQLANDAKSFLKTVAMKHIAGMLISNAGADKKIKYDDNKARELIEGTKLWMQEGPFFGSTPKSKGRKAEDLGQVLRMYMKLDLALDGTSMMNFMRALDQGAAYQGEVFTKIAPKGSRLRLAIAEDVRRSMGKGLLKEDEIDPLLSYAGFFDQNFQNYVRTEEAMEDTRSWFESGDGGGGKPKQSMSVVPLLEAVAKLCTTTSGSSDPSPEDTVLDVCEQCVANPVTWRLFGKVIDGVKNNKFLHDSDIYDMAALSECAKEMGKTGKLLAYKLQSGVAKSLQTDVEQVIDAMTEKSPPRQWIGSIRSLDTVIFLLEYMGKEDLGLAYQKFEHETKNDSGMSELVAAVKKIYNQPLATKSDLDISAAIAKKADMVKAPISWRGVDFGPEDWKIALDIATAAAETMKQRFSVIMLPHHTQLISMLMFGFRCCASRQQTDQPLPKTMLARVGTGEGKSLIIGMLAAFVAKKGMRAHVVNNNRVLTQRDYHGNANIFNMLGIQASANPADIKNKECMVCYCTGDDVEGSCLDSLMEGGADEYERGLEDAVLIVDEVDGLIFDRGVTSSKWFSDREFSDLVNEWFSQLMMQGKIQRDWDDFRGQEEWTNALQKEVEEAFADAENKQEGVDFTKRGDRLYILDPKTKMPREQDWALWLEILKSQRNHPAQWIEYKYEKAILCSVQCFMTYSCIFGLTGSLGGPAEKKYLGEQYEAVTFNVPPFLDTCRAEGGGIQGKKIPQHIEKKEPMNSEDQEAATIELAVAKACEVPVLVITKSAEAVKQMSEKVKQRLIEVYGAPGGGKGGEGEEEEEEAEEYETVIELLHNPRNPKEFVELVGRATEPVDPHADESSTEKRQVWKITLTTTEGGRGHDYRVVDPAIDEKGGLCLILTFVPWSEREWIQFIGRTGRQDHAGQYAVFLNTQDEEVQAAAPSKTAQESIIEAVLRHGDEQCAKMLQSMEEEIVKGRLMHTFTMRYWALHKQDKTSAKQNWDWKKLAKEYMGLPTKEIQDRFYAIFPHEKRIAPVETKTGPKPKIESLQSSKKEDLLQSTDGQRYKGDLVNGKPHGYGVFKTADGARYEGQWDQGQRSGKGKYVDASGATYEGQWKEHDKSGKGVESYPDKARYEGDFLKGCKHGVGKYTTSTGATYEGQFVKDKYDGEGTYDFTSGRKYIGQWKRGQMEGHGKMVWANGVSYEGSYEQDVRHGEGIVKWPDGRVYQGHWHKGRLVGSGVMLEKDGGQKLML